MLTDAQGRIMQPPSGSAPTTLTASYHKSTGNTSFQVENDFSQARMLASWGSSDYTIAASGDKYLITAGGRVYTFTPGSVGLGVPLPTIVAEFEVQAGVSTPRPVSQQQTEMYVQNFVTVGYNGLKQYGDPSQAWTLLTVYTPTDVVPDDPYSLILWIDWMSQESEEALSPLTVTECSYSSAEQDPIPASAIWSFGDLLTYPGIPTIG